MDIIYIYMYIQIKCAHTHKNILAVSQFIWLVKFILLRKCMGEERGAYRVLVGKPEGKNHWVDLGLDGWIILGWISRRWAVGIWT